MSDKINDLILDAKNRLAKLAVLGKISVDNELSINREIHALQKNGQSLDLVNMILRSSDEELILLITKKS